MSRRRVPSDSSDPTSALPEVVLREATPKSGELLQDLQSPEPQADQPPLRFGESNSPRTRAREHQKALPLFSVVIPIYDRTWELEQAIESISGQTEQSWELLLLLDGSPPSTREVVGRYSSDQRIRTFSYDESSGNACRCRNRGIVEARGDYIAFLDSDDIALPNRLELTRRCIEDTGADVVAGCALYHMTGSRSGQVPESGTRSQAVPLSLGCLYRLNPFVTSCMAVSRSSLLAHGGFRPAMRYREDHELWLRLYHRGCVFHFSQELHGIYRIHDGNLEAKINSDPSFWEKAVKTEYLLRFQDWGI